MNQRKTRPTRAERARQKTRMPNLPQERPSAGRSFEPALPREDAAPAPAQAGTSARVAPRMQAGTIQDYSYVRTDLIRIMMISSVLLALMVALAVLER